MPVYDFMHSYIQSSSEQFSKRKKYNELEAGVSLSENGIDYFLNDFVKFFFTDLFIRNTYYYINYVEYEFIRLQLILPNRNGNLNF